MAKKLNEINSMPQLQAVLSGWSNKITLTVITETVVNGFVQIIETPRSFIGTIQPLSPKTIELKPEGQRAFAWLQIHCRSGSLNLTTNDRIIVNGDRFKIMANNDYSRNGFTEYHAIKDYEAVT